MARRAPPRGHRSGVRDRWSGRPWCRAAQARAAALVSVPADTAPWTGARAAGRTALPRLYSAGRASLPSPVAVAAQITPAAQPRLILASASPRRRELLEQIGVR